MRVRSLYSDVEYDVIREELDSYVVLSNHVGGQELQMLKANFEIIPEVHTLVQAEDAEAHARHEVRVTDPNTGGQKGSKPQQPAQIPPEFLLALGEHYAKGQAKYPDSEPGRPNWSRGYAWSLSVNSLMRHLLSWLAGEEFDEDGNSNLIAVAWHAATLHTFQAKGLGTDDRPVY